VALSGDSRVDRTLGLVAARQALVHRRHAAGDLLTWVAIDFASSTHHYATKRAAAVKSSVPEPEGLHLDLEDLRGSDELGLLAGVLADLLQRVEMRMPSASRFVPNRKKTCGTRSGHESWRHYNARVALHSMRADPSQRYIERSAQAGARALWRRLASEAILSPPCSCGRSTSSLSCQNVADNARMRHRASGIQRS